MSSAINTNIAVADTPVLRRSTLSMANFRSLTGSHLSHTNTATPPPYTATTTASAMKTPHPHHLSTPHSTSKYMSLDTTPATLEHLRTISRKTATAAGLEGELRKHLSN